MANKDVPNSDGLTLSTLSNLQVKKMVLTMQEAEVPRECKKI